MRDVIIPFGDRFLVLSDDQLKQALARGEDLFPRAEQQQGSSSERILDAEGMAEITQIPASWFLEQARRKQIPHLRVGKYVRFALAETLEALRATVDTRTDGPDVRRKNARTQQIDVHTDGQSVAPRKKATGQ